MVGEEVKRGLSMQGKRIIRSLRLCNFLSFGNEEQKIELQPLNVLIGPNASGKSNLIEAFRLLNAAPEDIGNPIREGGGIREYLWKGSQAGSYLDIEVVVEWNSGNSALDYSIGIRNDNARLDLFGEIIKLSPLKEWVYSKLGNERGILFSTPTAVTSSTDLPLTTASSEIKVSRDRSILSQFKDPNRFPELTHLQNLFSAIHFYTGWNLGRYGALRYPQKADLPSTTLLEDGSNLGLVLINKPASVRQQITERLKAVLPTVEEIFPKIEGGSVPLYIREKGFSTPTPAARLSEGTLRYLCLLTLLLDPTPPPIICLEEPEAGLHPHVVSQIAELLINASQRTQLIVTTHSDALISGLTDCPEAIIICERDDEGTKLRRLEAAQIKPWLDRYAIGDLWRMGEIGGVR